MKILTGYVFSHRYFVQLPSTVCESPWDTSYLFHIVGQSMPILYSDRKRIAASEKPFIIQWRNRTGQIITRASSDREEIRKYRGRFL